MPRLSSLAALVLLLAIAPSISAQWRIEVKGIPKQKTEIVNKTGYAVRIHLFKQQDVVRSVPLKTGNRVIAANESWLVDSEGTAYRANVFKSQLVDKLVGTDVWIVGKTTLTVRGGKVVASTSAATTIRNASNEKIKVCIYNEKDRVNAVPKAVLTIAAGKKIEYAKPDTPRFRMAAFRPAVIDELLASTVARDRAHITIEPDARVIWAFGDSLTAGVKEGGGAKASYPAQLQGMLVNHTIVNKGQEGEVVSKEAAEYFKMEQWGRRRLAKELDDLARAKAKLPDLILLCQGANDRLAVMADNINATRRRKIEDGLKSDLEAMIRHAKGLGVQVVLISQVNELRLNQYGLPVATGIPGTPPAYYAQIARSTGIPVDGKTLPQLYNDVPSWGKNLTSDKRHLSQAGSKRVAEGVTKFLLDNKLVVK